MCRKVFQISLLLVFCLENFQVRCESALRIQREWAELEYVFPSEEIKQEALNNGDFIPGPISNVPIDVDVYYGSKGRRIFITIPRFGKGRPMSLGTIDEKGRVNAYPDYSWHNRQGKNCDGITSSWRTAIDECNRIWVMDSGQIDGDQVCGPQLLAFDLSTDKLVFRHRFDPSLYNCQSLLITPVVDVPPQRPGGCSNAFVYVADVGAFAMLVVDVARNRSWKIANKFYYPSPSRGSFTVEGESFDLMDGVLGMALSPIMPDNNERFLYFHALAATTENRVRASTLRNDSFIQDPNADPKDISVLPGERPNQSAAEAMDRDGILYYGLMNPPSIWCWNSARTFTTENFYPIAIDRETLQFASGVKVINNPKGGQELWVLTSRFQKVMTGSMNGNETNFRILSRDVASLVLKSPCKIFRN